MKTLKEGVTVHDLRRLGYKVQVLHNRVMDRSGRYPIVEPRGGNTVILLYNKKRTRLIGTGFMYCSNEENYNRKTGVQYALSNLLNDIAEVVL